MEGHHEGVGRIDHVYCPTLGRPHRSRHFDLSRDRLLGQLEEVLGWNEEGEELGVCAGGYTCIGGNGCGYTNWNFIQDRLPLELGESMR